MNFNKKMAVILCFFLLGSIAINAQVQFKLTLLEDEKTYLVSIVPEVTYQPPANLTSTGQVTLKALNKGLMVQQIVNLQPDVVWEFNSLTESPKESEEYDYVSFGLISQGTKNLRYEAGIELPLFTFTNAAECQGTIALIDNWTDPFSPPNSRQVNVGNQITILGARGDAYIGNVETTTISCGANAITGIEEINREIVNLSIFPNPARNDISLSMEWQRKAEVANLMVLDKTGKVVLKKRIQLFKGSIQEQIELKNLAQGSYFIELNGVDWKISSKQFVKMAH